MPNLLFRFISIGDTHGYQTNLGYSYGGTNTIGVDERDENAVPPEEHDDLVSIFHDRFQKWKEKDGGVDFFIHTGDIINSDDLQDNQDFYDLMFKPLDIEDYYASGNHDTGMNDTDWESVYGHKKNHSFEKGEYAFVILDSGGRTDCIEYNWLIEQLNSYEDKEGIFLICHIPRYSGEFRGDPITSPEERGADSPDCKDIWDALKQQENLIFCLHGHFHEFNNIMMNDGIPIIFTNHWGGYGVNQYGLRIFEIYDNGSVYTYLDSFYGTVENEEINYTNLISSYYNLMTKFPRTKTKRRGIFSIFNF